MIMTTLTQTARHTDNHPIQASLVAIVARVGHWIEVRRERRALASLSDELLKDIGFSRYDAVHEASKPFWRD
jgi:uncharacterized protein YjiS (DUF1127 family)